MHRRPWDIGRVSSAALLASGIAGIVMPGRFAAALHVTPSDPRGVAEVRAGLGGTYAALGGWALLSSAPAARRAVGMTWLGAAAARLAALRLDRPETDLAYWSYLAGEIALGSAALLSAATQD
jgi:hypothetical protein